MPGSSLKEGGPENKSSREGRSVSTLRGLCLNLVDPREQDYVISSDPHLLFWMKTLLRYALTKSVLVPR